MKGGEYNEYSLHVARGRACSHGCALEVMMSDRGRVWKRQTLNTVLARLERKGAVSRKRGYVQAQLTPDELLQKQTEGILVDFYEGKLTNFCSALIGRNRLRNSGGGDLTSLIKELQEKEKGL